MSALRGQTTLPEGDGLRGNRWTHRSTDPIPVRWIGPLASLPDFLRRDAVAELTPKALRKWLRAHGFRLDPRRGKGSHCGFEGHGVEVVFSTSRPTVPMNEQRVLAGRLGFDQLSRLRRAVARHEPPPVAAHRRSHA